MHWGREERKTSGPVLCIGTACVSEHGPVLLVDSDPPLRSEVIATLARAQIKQVIAASTAVVAYGRLDDFARGPWGLQCRCFSLRRLAATRLLRPRTPSAPPASSFGQTIGFRSPTGF